jgi:peptidoglycan/LPS O-acetylase OafA/YrhL
MQRSITIAEGLERRQDNFLLLRIIAALLVIYGHSFGIAPHGSSKEVFVAMGWGIYSGDIAVNMFFVISGFMVSGSYIRQPDLFEFMKARLLRIVPGLLACLLVLALVVGPLVTSWLAKDYFHDRSVFDYVIRNMKFASDMNFNLPGVFETNAKRGVVNGSLWTLPAEFRMYVFVAVLGAVGLLERRLALAIVIVLLVITGLVAPYQLPLHPDWLRLAGYFAVGILIFTYKKFLTISHEGFIAVVFATYLCRGLEIHLYVFVFALTYFCFWFAYLIKLPRLDAYGDPSYAIYLWGWPIQQLVAKVMPNAISQVNFAVASVLAIAIGYASWYLVEKPCLRFKYSFSRKSPLAL